ncbi:hypothetical protein G7054_g6515 [Neopestalotiopsis clavispora]|nr:hypothetical protein G7054_g6515 [Neopestalotiopsis clavispora]
MTLEVPGSLNDVPVDSRSLRDPAPYLGRSARISQAWLNRWTILLLLVLARILFLVDHLNGEIDQAKAKALSACTKVEDIGSAMASMPYYLSSGVNQLAASGITEAVQGMVKSLDLLLTAMQALLLFVINMMTSTYTCLIAALVHGGLNVSALVMEKSSEAVNNVLPAIADDIGGIVDQVQGSIDSAWSWIDDLSGLFGGKPIKPSLDITDDLNDIRNFRIDSSGFVSDINNINEALPTFKDVQNLTVLAVAVPFGLVKAALNTTLGDWRFNASAFPLAEKSN